MKNELVVLGAAGFLGQEVVRRAVAASFRVHAVVRSQEQAARLAALGARPVVEDVATGDTWLDAARRADVVVDLIQPKLPRRLTPSVMRDLARARVHTTNAVVSALARLHETERPLLFCVSGLDDLEPDRRGNVSHASALRTEPVGFGHIGLAVEDVVARSEIAAARLHLGTVYGPGKAFAETVFPGLLARKVPIVGDGKNRLPLVHVEDAAGAIVHLATLDRARLLAHPWIVADGTGTTQADLLRRAATLLDAKEPRSVPRWLAAIFAGSVLADGFSRDVATDPSALVEAGFVFRHPDIESGLVASIAAFRELADDRGRAA